MVSSLEMNNAFRKAGTCASLADSAAVEAVTFCCFGDPLLRGETGDAAIRV
jgi:hypothetical protein